MRVRMNGYIINKTFKGYEVFRRNVLVATKPNYSEAFRIAGGE